jgi:hypothetical protein
MGLVAEVRNILKPRLGKSGVVELTIAGRNISFGRAMIAIRQTTRSRVIAQTWRSWGALVDPDTGGYWGRLANSPPIQDRSVCDEANFGGHNCIVPCGANSR